MCLSAVMARRIRPDRPVPFLPQYEEIYFVAPFSKACPREAWSFPTLALPQGQRLPSGTSRQSGQNSTPALKSLNRRPPDGK